MLLLWPTLWALWLASEGYPDSQICLVFIFGVFIMRSAGCVLNDLADRKFDAHVKRTRTRPLASGQVSVKEALFLAAVLISAAFMLVLCCNRLTIVLSVAGAGLAIVYPLLKRITHLPQFGLGMAFTWGVPMAFAAVTDSVETSAWFLFMAGILWPIIYDTMYAMVDRDDDLKIGVKSTAILFNAMDKLIVGLLQALFLIMMVIVGMMFQLHFVYYFCLSMAGFLFAYQQWLIKDRIPQKCFEAFRNNNWVGLVIFAGIFLSYLGDM